MPLTALSGSQVVFGSSGIPQFSTPSIGFGAKAAINLLLYSFISTLGAFIIFGMTAAIAALSGVVGFTSLFIAVGFTTGFFSTFFLS